MARILFDVGANDGSSLLGRLQPDDIVYAFEPTPTMFQNILDRTKHIPHYHAFQVAVSDYEGTAEFKISGYEDWGCSSLLDYSPNLESNWGSRRFEVTDKITVKVIRLSDFIYEHNIPWIDYFHCDTQGSDLRVLKGMGEFISIIREGVVEAARKPDVLYTGQNSEEETVKFLLQNGFEITNISANDGGVNEVNISFRR